MTGFSPRIKGLAIAALVLGGLALFGRPAPDAAPAVAWRLPPFAQVEQIELRRTGMAAVVLERTPAGWRAGPAPVDPGALRILEEVLGAGVRADAADAVAETALDRLGLTDDALTATVVGGGRTETFRIGKAPDGQRTFVLPAGGDRVLRARAPLRRAFERTPDEWRDRRLFADTTYRDVQRLRLTRGDRPDWSVARAGPDAPWTLDGGGLLDQDTVAGIVNTFATLQAKSFPGDDPAFKALVRLEGQTFDGRALVLDYDPRRPSGPHVRRLPDGPVAQLPPHVGPFLDVSSGALADRRLFPGATEAAKGLVIGGANPLRLERTEAGWTLDGAPLPAAAQPRIQAVLEARAAGVIERVPPDAFTHPFHTVLVRLADDRQLALTLGSEFQAGSRYARNIEGESRTFVVSAATVAALTPTREALTQE